MADTRRIVALADQWRIRVRSCTAAENAQWLADETTPLDRNHLLYVLGAALPDEPVAELLRWVDHDVDEVAVARACEGQQVQLNEEETNLAIQRLALRGLGPGRIGRRLNLHTRTIQRRLKRMTLEESA